MGGGGGGMEGGQDQGSGAERAEVKIRVPGQSGQCKQSGVGRVFQDKKIFVVVRG